MSEFDVAVIGLSCRFPGAPYLDSFWRNIVGGVCSIRRLDRNELLRNGVAAKMVGVPGYVPAPPPGAGSGLIFPASPCRGGPRWSSSTRRPMVANRCT
jgi:hypothetical protein